MNDKMFPRRFTEALRPGAYLRIVVEGDVGAGDEIRVVERPAHRLTIQDVFRIYTRDRDEVQRLLTVPRMSESWKRWAVDWLQQRNSQRTEAAEPIFFRPRSGAKTQAQSRGGARGTADP